VSTAEVEREDAEAVPLSDQAVARLRQSRTWTRVVAVAALAFAAAVMFTTTISVVRLTRAADDALRVARTVGLAVVGLAAALGCATLAWAYADGVDAFLHAGEPGLARAFRSLRRLLAFGTAMLVASLLYSGHALVKSLLR